MRGSRVTQLRIEDSVLEVGDTITGVGGLRPKSELEWQKAWVESLDNEEIDVEIVRQGKRLKLTVNSEKLRASRVLPVERE